MNKDFNSKSYEKDFKIVGTSILRINKILNFIGSDKDVIDLGCGDGYISEIIIKNGNRVLGVEIAEPAIKKAVKKGIRVFDYDLNSDFASYIPEKFDMAVAGEIIEHIFDTDRFLKNIHNVLKPGGELVITTPNIAALGRRLMLLLGLNPLIETTARPRDAGHIRYFTYQSLKTLLSENGFKTTNFESDCVNFNAEGTLSSTLLARLLPKLGRCLIVKAVKTSLISH